MQYDINNEANSFIASESLHFEFWTAVFMMADCLVITNSSLYYYCPSSFCPPSPQQSTNSELAVTTSTWKKSASRPRRLTLMFAYPLTQKLGKEEAMVAAKNFPSRYIPDSNFFLLLLLSYWSFCKNRWQWSFLRNCRSSSSLLLL